MILLTLGILWVYFMLTEKPILCLITALFTGTSVLLKSVTVIFTTGQNLVICERTRGLNSDFNPFFKHMFNVSLVEVTRLLRAHPLNVIVRCWIELLQRTSQPKREWIFHLAKVCADLLFT